MRNDIKPRISANSWSVHTFYCHFHRLVAFAFAHTHTQSLSLTTSIQTPFLAHIYKSMCTRPWCEREQKDAEWWKVFAFISTWISSTCLGLIYLRIHSFRFPYGIFLYARLATLTHTQNQANNSNPIEAADELKLSCFTTKLKSINHTQRTLYSRTYSLTLTLFSVCVNDGFLGCDSFCFWKCLIMIANQDLWTKFFDKQPDSVSFAPCAHVHVSLVFECQQWSHANWKPWKIWRLIRLQANDMLQS